MKTGRKEETKKYKGGRKKAIELEKFDEFRE